MVETVTDIIVARGREPEGLKAMVVWSIVGHIGIVVIALLWPGPDADQTPRTVMTVSLSGAPGPRTGGITQIGGQAVQAPPPQEAPQAPEAPPAAKAPAMSLPDPRARTRPQAKPAQAPPEATARTTNTGGQPREGNARGQRAPGVGFGLSSSGGNGSPVQLDVTDFCCVEYLDQMVTVIKRPWEQNQGVVGSTTMKFTILRNGTITDPQVEKSSGFVALDSASMRALQLSRLPALPEAFPNSTLTVHMRFDYQR